VGHEKLNVEMQRLYGKQLTVLKIPKSGGVRNLAHCLIHTAEFRCQVVELDHGYRERVHNLQLHTYMYGQVFDAPPGVSSPTLAGEPMTDLALAPSSSIVNFADLAIYRIGAGMNMFPPFMLC
jgi:polyribonucleotide 5'-hydroxyl-kinase